MDVGFGLEQEHHVDMGLFGIATTAK